MVIDVALFYIGVVVTGVALGFESGVTLLLILGVEGDVVLAVTLFLVMNLRERELKKTDVHRATATYHTLGVIMSVINLK